MRLRLPFRFGVVTLTECQQLFVRARIELANPGARLKPGMYAQLSFEMKEGKKGVLVPSEAVIRTGTRDVVLVAQGEGKFRAVGVEVGTEARGQSEIRKGLQAGDKVVLSGQFLIDSEASLSATVARLEGASGEISQGDEAKTHAGTGKVLSVDADSGYVELDHDPIAALKWPRMSMGFQVEDRHSLHELKAGDRVQFQLLAKPDKEGNFLIRKIERRS